MTRRGLYIIMMEYSYGRRRQWHPTPVLLPGKSHGQRSLVGCGPWGHEESDTTERLHFHSSLSCIGEGNGSPLQYSCLENPRDGGAWWAAVYGVTESGTTEATWQQQQHSYDRPSIMLIAAHSLTSSNHQKLLEGRRSPAQMRAQYHTAPQKSTGIFNSS